MSAKNRDSEPRDGETPRGERGRRSPAVPLGDAVQFLHSVNKELGTGPASRDAVAQALGYRSINGAVTTKIGALTHFGLLERDGATYQIAELGKRLLYPKGDAERRSALAAAALAPALYADIVRDRSGQPLPGMLANILIHDYGVHPEKASEVVEVFQATMQFAGLLRQGVLHSTIASPPTSAEPTEPSAAPGSIAPPAPRDGVSVQSESAGALMAYRVPLSHRRSAVLRLPTPLEPADIQRIKQWLDLMSDALTDTNPTT
jgi:hypothetical protein